MNVSRSLAVAARRQCLFRTRSAQHVLHHLPLTRRSGGSRGRRGGTSASRGRGPSGAGSSRGSRGRGPASPTGLMPCSSVAPWTTPRFTPAPASHELNAQLWCSRPGLSARVVERRAAELRRPDDQHVVEQPAPLQVLDQPGDRLIDLRRQPAVVGHVAVRVPVAARPGVDQFDEADAALDQPPGDEALPAEPVRAARASGRRARASRRSPSRRSSASGISRLHPERRLERLDARREVRVVRPVGLVRLVERLRARRVRAPGASSVGTRRRGWRPAPPRARRASPGARRAGSPTPTPACRRRASAGRAPGTTAGSGSPCRGRSSAHEPMLGRANANEPVCMPSVAL